MPPQIFDIRDYLQGLPRRDVSCLPEGTPFPRLKSVGNLSDYNGFTGKERLRTFEVAKWLISLGAMKHSGSCSICGGRGDQQHAEDYFDLTTWMDICRSCHASLHGRFRTPEAWQRRVDNLQLAEKHWARVLPTFPIDVAGFHRANGRTEPTPVDFMIN